MSTPRVVIVGAGIVGTNLADELTARGLGPGHRARSGPAAADRRFDISRSGPRLPNQRVEDDDGLRPIHGREVRRHGSRRPMVLQPGRRSGGCDDRRSASPNCIAGRAGRHRGASRAPCSNPQECVRIASTRSIRVESPWRTVCAEPTDSPRRRAWSLRWYAAPQARGAVFRESIEGDRH